MLKTLKKLKQTARVQPKSRSDQQAMNLAASWYVAMPSKELKKKPKAIELFCQPLVAWRNQQRHPVIMERFCAHMGASLALGKLKDSCLQCPFHHWEFDSTGECVSIPEIDKIPPTARQKTYVTVERYGYIWVWYGTEEPLFPLPEFPPAESEQKNYMPCNVSFEVHTTVCSVIENAYDPIHVVALHNLQVSEPIQVSLLDSFNTDRQTELLINHEARFGVIMQGKIDSFWGPISPIVEALGLKIGTFKFQVESWPSGHVDWVYFNEQEAFMTLASITPITENKLLFNVIYAVKKRGNFIVDLIYYLLFGVYNASVSAKEDVLIFNTMKPDRGGVYVKTDRSVMKFREFYRHWVEQTN
jgi:aminopyrrolnitrin oxygenase